MTGSHAGADQQTAAIDDCQRLWPHNGHLVNDPQIEATLLDRARGPWPELLPATVTLLWSANEALMALGLGNRVEDVVRRTAPPRVAACDRCNRSFPEPEAPPFGVLVLPFAPLLVALTACDVCALELNALYEPVWIPLERH